jgi:hypothetical protein
MTLAGKVAEAFNAFRADAVFVDGGGVGGGVVDRLRQLHVPCFDIQFGAKADAIPAEDETDKFANKRAEMWGALRKALKSGLAIPNDDQLKQELVAVEYGFNQRDEIQLERKSGLKKRLPNLGSPDIADALALTFAYPVAASASAGRLGADQEPQVEHEYDPFADARAA